MSTSKRLYQRSALLGFTSMNRYSDKHILPCVHAQQWGDSGGSVPDAGKLWTLRAVTVNGGDAGMPWRLRLSPEEAVRWAEQDQKDYQCCVFFYPYFFAEKSGTLTICKDRAIIEAVQGDHPEYRHQTGDVFDVEIEISEQFAPITQYMLKSGRRLPNCHNPDKCLHPCKISWKFLRGNVSILKAKEILEIAGYLPCIRCECKKELNKGNRVHLKWSFAYDTDLKGRPEGSRYLIFFEMKILKPPQED